MGSDDAVDLRQRVRTLQQHVQQLREESAVHTSQYQGLLGLVKALKQTLERNSVRDLASFCCGRAQPLD